MNSLIKQTGLIVGSGSIIAMLTLGGTAFAESSSGQGGNHQGFGGHGMNMGMKNMPGVFGTVSAINGTTLTVTTKLGRQMGDGDSDGNDKGIASTTTPTSFTVNASGATVTKNNASSTLSAIVIGDTVMVTGTVNGSNVTATSIIDGMGPMGMHEGMHGKGHGGPGGNEGSASGVPALIGNGLPIIGGTVVTVSGTALTITNKSNVTYSVNAASSSILKAGVSSTLASVLVGDTVVVQGTINGTAITASSIIDQGIVSTSSNSSKGFGKNLLGSIGALFQHFFGF